MQYNITLYHIIKNNTIYQYIKKNEEIKSIKNDRKKIKNKDIVLTEHMRIYKDKAALIVH